MQPRYRRTKGRPGAWDPTRTDGVDGLRHAAEGVVVGAFGIIDASRLPARLGDCEMHKRTPPSLTEFQIHFALGLGLGSIPHWLCPLAQAARCCRHSSVAERTRLPLQPWLQRRRRNLPHRRGCCLAPVAVGGRMQIIGYVQ